MMLKSFHTSFDTLTSPQFFPSTTLYIGPTWQLHLLAVSGSLSRHLPENAPLLIGPHVVKRRDNHMRKATSKDFINIVGPQQVIEASQTEASSHLPLSFVVPLYLIHTIGLLILSLPSKTHVLVPAVEVVIACDALLVRVRFLRLSWRSVLDSP
ncbi:hypothetical protein VNO77_04432 [Canavalia gladiata]|uniref:Uncharacterized protein n=1 Tax=Canavalia gladiata TaxID=3824 RepID=A0AAN9MX59_CANGL